MQPLKLTRPLASIDVETTGLSLARDRITSLAVVVYPQSLDFSPGTHKWLINPGIPIPPEVEELTGITNAMVKGQPSFNDLAIDILEVLEPYDYIGFNLRRFDIPILHEHFVRAGQYWNVREKNIIDVGELFQIKDPRTLEAAVVKFCGREHIGAHDAANDAKETVAVLSGMFAWFEELQGLDVAALAKETHREEFLDLAGKVKIGKDGRPTYTFGERTRDVAVEDDWNQSEPGRSFAEWVIRNDFPSDTKQVLRGLLDEFEAKQSQQP